MYIKFEYDKKKFVCILKIKPGKSDIIHKKIILYTYKIFSNKIIKKIEIGNYEDIINEFNSYTEEQLTDYVKERVIKDYELKIKAKKWS